MRTKSPSKPSKNKRKPSSIPMGEYVDRLRKVQEVLGRFNYHALYEYEYNEVLSPTDRTRMMNFWNFRHNDLKWLNRFEWMAEHINEIPELAKQPK